MTPVPQSLSCRLNWAGEGVLQEAPPFFVWGYKLLTVFPGYRSRPGIRSHLPHWAVWAAGCGPCWRLAGEVIRDTVTLEGLPGNIGLSCQHCEAKAAPHFSE